LAAVCVSNTLLLQLLLMVKEKKRKDAAGSDDTASMIKGGGYLRARTRQTIKKNLMWVKGYKDGLQPESLADGNWLVKQNQPVSKVETKSDTNLRSLYES